jgi:hypothetical protein
MMFVIDFQKRKDSIKFSITHKRIKILKKYGCKELSRTDCMAESDGSNCPDLSNSEKIAEGGTVCPVEPNATSGSVHTEQHSGGTSAKLNEGVYSISLGSKGQQSRVGNTTATVREGELPCPYGYFGSNKPVAGSGENAGCPYKNTDKCPLKEVVKEVVSE